MVMRMKAPTHHRRVLHFAVTGALLGGLVGCAGTEPAKPETKSDSKPETKLPEPDVKLAPNPGPKELDPSPTPPPIDPEQLEPDYVNEGPIEEPPPPVEISPSGQSND